MQLKKTDINIINNILPFNFWQLRTTTTTSCKSPSETKNIFAKISVDQKIKSQDITIKNTKRFNGSATNLNHFHSMKNWIIKLELLEEIFLTKSNSYFKGANFNFSSENHLGGVSSFWRILLLLIVLDGLKHFLF